MYYYYAKVDEFYYSTRNIEFEKEFFQLLFQENILKFKWENNCYILNMTSTEYIMAITNVYKKFIKTFKKNDMNLTSAIIGKDAIYVIYKDTYKYSCGYNNEKKPEGRTRLIVQPDICFSILRQILKYANYLYRRNWDNNLIVY